LKFSRFKILTWLTGNFKLNKISCGGANVFSKYCLQTTNFTISSDVFNKLLAIADKRTGYPCVRKRFIGLVFQATVSHVTEVNLVKQSSLSQRWRVIKLDSNNKELTLLQGDTGSNHSRILTVQ